MKDKSLEYFKQIMQIPRPSSKEEKIADFLCKFAKKNKLDCYRDKVNNVIIKKWNGSNKTIILQGHTDMVCVAEKGLVKNFNTEGIDWVEEDDFIRAKGTSLGADNGAGVSVILSLLEEESKDLPNIEAVFTVQEETSMLGANELDCSKLTAKTLLSLDGSSEGVLEISSAGFCDLTLQKELKTIKQPEGSNLFSVEVSNLLGGHSGEDIDKNRLSAIEILGKILKEINPIGIISIYGGDRNNVISSNAICDFATEKSAGEVSYICSKYRTETEENDNHPNIIFSRLDDSKWTLFDEDEITALISEFQQGVLEFDDKNFPIISENMGMLRLADGQIKVGISVRSSDKEKQEKQLKVIEKLAKKHKFECVINHKNPFFVGHENSRIREILKAVYQKQTGKPAKEKRIHAGLEGGVFAEHIDGLDICVIAPDIFDLHSTKEKVRVSSIKRVYSWVYESLIEFAK
jgi:dipeptidase D